MTRGIAKLSTWDGRNLNRINANKILKIKSQQKTPLETPGYQYVSSRNRNTESKCLRTASQI